MCIRDRSVINMINDISTIANNLLFRKIIYKYDPESKQAKGTLYLSIIHPKSKPSNLETVDNIKIQ